MSHPRLRSPNQPWPLRVLLGLFEFCASLKLAVVLIFSAAFVLAAATWVEKFYGIAGVQYGMYGTWWFTLLNFLLAVNIFCAAAIRFPWKRHQTGFVITHIGLLTLLFGCYLQRRDGIDAQIPIAEGETSHIAVGDDQYFELIVKRPATAAEEAAHASADANEPVAGKLEAGTGSGSATWTSTTEIPFVPGPFNWKDYSATAEGTVGADGKISAATGLFGGQRRKIPLLPWALARRDQGLIYDQDGIRLEALDYYSQAFETDVPFVRLQLSMPQMKRQRDDGSEEVAPESWIPVALQIAPTPAREFRTRSHSRRKAGGGDFLLLMTDDKAETAAFLDSHPQGPLGERGQVVAHIDGKKFTFNVDDHLGKGRTSLPNSDYEVELVQYFPAGIVRSQPADEPFKLVDLLEDQAERTQPPKEAVNPSIELKVYHGDKSSRLALFADRPEMNCQEGMLAVVGNYWFDHGQTSTEVLQRGGGTSRIDILQGPDLKLYFRYWNRKQLAETGPLPVPAADEQYAAEVNAFKMPIAQLTMRVEEYVGSTKLEKRLLPLPFNKSLAARDVPRGVLVRMTVDEKTEEFWLLGPTVNSFSTGSTQTYEHVIKTDGRSVALRLRLEEYDAGYNIRLREFERKLDAGTDQARHFGSRIDFLSKENGQPVQENVHIMMNAPVDYVDPGTERKYRLFQESFNGPFTPSDPEFAKLFPHATDDKPRYLTVLTVNFDPGRGTKQIGSLLICAGIATMFFMRAYFFKRPEKPKPVARQRELVQV